MCWEEISFQLIISCLPTFTRITTVVYAMPLEYQNMAIDLLA